MKKLALSVLFFGMISLISAQQSPQYTQYMYNTQIINPAYAGSRETLSLGLLGRYQWVDLEGSPKTGTFTVNLPVGFYDNMGIGASIVHDQIGPAIESNAAIDIAYSLHLARRNVSKLSFGLKAGVDMLDVDYSKINLFNPNDPFFQNNVDSKIQPQVGAGIYYNTQNFYTGVSVPNFLSTQHYDEQSLVDENIDGIVVERLHYFFIAGYVFDLSPNIKLKPATLWRLVSGAPIQWDLSANFMFNEKFVIGASYRWNASISGLLGFQISNSIFAGVGYDYQSTAIEDYSNGSYEVFLRFDIFNQSEKIVAPRFF
ncbi:type IX secretion system membrane protein PorP/SprF [Flagellimonas pacifica]|uniref:PorP/SprF family type IX secretion system membrane protein n=1 Tax=Flagellimonas pacifica TaxID=1247520 RepID=UPI001FAF41AB|nr:type IX secretion system membrane protein PorP/SprF [Allomuricauda parva]